MVPVQAMPPLSGEFTRARKVYFGPLKYSILLLSSPVSLCFQSRGFPSFVSFPVIIADVQAYDSVRVKAIKSVKSALKIILFIFLSVIL